jgi:hypothetical protein
MDTILTKVDTIGWFLGSNKTMEFPSYWMGGHVWGTDDSIKYKDGNPIIFIVKIIYEDALGRFHFTQQGGTQTISKPTLTGLRKYYRTDHDK